MTGQRGKVATTEPGRMQVGLFACVRGVGAVGCVVGTGRAVCIGTRAQQWTAPHVDVRIRAVLLRLGLWGPGVVTAGHH